jgi:hypothetical protein
MSLIHIRTKFYPNCLPSAKGKYIARAEAALSVEQACQSAKERGGIPANNRERSGIYGGVAELD